MTGGPETWLNEHGDTLYRFALSRLRDRALAEDAVQETLLGALRNYKDFEGRAEVRTWLVGILRNKIADHLRRAGRQKEEATERVFDDRGEWAVAPGDWHDPDEQIRQKEFQSVFQDCVGRLPEPLAEAFLLREVEEEDYEVVCDQLEISATNLSTRLYRARLLLRKCLEENWFGGALKR